VLSLQPWSIMMDDPALEAIIMGGNVSLIAGQIGLMLGPAAHRR